MKRLFVSLLASIALLGLLPNAAVFAQAPPPSGMSIEEYCKSLKITENWKFQSSKSNWIARNCGLDMNQQAHSGVAWDLGLLNFSEGAMGSGCVEAMGGNAGCIQKSVVGKMNQTIADMYANPPADLGLWIADAGHTLGFIPDRVYAQGRGIGFSGLAPLLPIWKAFRNVAYLLMAVVMVILGFLIMFRKKIDPKTVVTAQNAIPRVVITLILITFSYAIVGFMIDIMYILLYFAIALISSTGKLPSEINGMSPLQFFGQGGLMSIFSTNAGTIDPFKLLFGMNMGGGWSSFLAGLGATTVTAALGAFGGGFFGLPVIGGAIGALPFIGLPLLQFILAIALLFLFIRLLAFFLMTYVQIIMSLIFAPLQLLAEAFPGSEAFSGWFKNLISNLAVFPIAGVMFMLATVFSTMADTGPKWTPDIKDLSSFELPAPNTDSFWAPPYTSLNLSIGSAQLTNSNNMTSIASLLSLGILFAIPTIAGSVKEALKAKPMGGMFDMGGAGGVSTQWLSQAYYIKSLMPSQFLDTLTGNKGGHDKHGG